MSTTDKIRADFEAWQRDQQGWLYTEEAEPGTFQEDRWIAWQAATEAAKATGTAGELADNFQQAWAKFSDGTHKSPRDIGLYFWEAAMQYADAGNEEFRKDVKRLTERCCDVQAENLALKAEAARQPAPVDAKYSAMLKIVEAVRRDGDAAFAHLLQDFDAARSQP